MTVFAVVAVNHAAALKAAVERTYGISFHQFADNVWFVSDSGTPRSVADKLGLTDGAIGANGVVLKLSSYSGYAPTSAWTWMQQYPEAWS